jgi:hypothetical protein
VHDVRAAVEAVTTDPDLRARIIHAGYANARRFAPARIAEQYAAIYRELVNPRASRRSAAFEANPTAGVSSETSFRGDDHTLRRSRNGVRDLRSDAFGKGAGAIVMLDILGLVLWPLMHEVASMSSRPMSERLRCRR